MNDHPQLPQSVRRHSQQVICPTDGKHRRLQTIFPIDFPISSDSVACLTVPRIVERYCYYCTDSYSKFQYSTRIGKYFRQQKKNVFWCHDRIFFSADHAAIWPTGAAVAPGHRIGKNVILTEQFDEIAVCHNRTTLAYPRQFTGQMHSTPSFAERAGGEANGPRYRPPQH